MLSVTQRISQVKQPYGGYVNPSKMLTRTSFGFVPSFELKDENVHAGLVGIAVDYLTRVMVGTPVKRAFRVSFFGATDMNQRSNAEALARRIKGLDDDSIIAACKLVGYDSAFRAGSTAFRPVEGINPNEETISNVRKMVASGINFFKEYGPVTHDGLTFEGGYTDIVSTGDGDFMTADTLWDFKCSVKPPTSRHTLQIVMYWLMGLHSIHVEEYRSLKRLGFFNPRLGSIYTFDIAGIPAETLHEIEVSVIGYSEINALF